MLIKYYVIKHLILLKIQRGIPSMVYKFFDTKTSGGTLNHYKLYLIKILQKNYTNQLLENLRKESTLSFRRQYLGHRSSRYAIDK